MARPKNARIFKSKYPGRCDECNARINPGDTIAWVRGTYTAHEGCFHGNAPAPAPTTTHGSLDDMTKTDPAPARVWDEPMPF